MRTLLVQSFCQRFMCATLFSDANGQGHVGSVVELIWARDVGGGVGWC
jgi:hypothetical protein